LSLTTCLQKAKGALDAEHRAAIIEAAAAYRTQGMSTHDASVRAVDDRIALLRAELDAAGSPVAEAAEAPAPIEDVGEKIGGARKDTASSGLSRVRRAAAEDDRPAWARRFKVSQIVKAAGQINSPRDEGRWIINDSRSLNPLGQPRQVGRVTFATKEEAEAYVPIAAVSLKHRAVPTRDGKYEIWRDISDRKRVKVVEREFDTRDDALAYMAQHPTEIIETNTTFGEADIPVPPDRARTGPQRRSGDVNGEDFRSTFGFRGVEFGNWNNQEERQALMNDAWDGLMDLAEILSLPPRALGLNGDLALAFGARGHGLMSARAHYEHARVVMNLTKEHGAGSLAHEWFHALDHYFGRQDGKASATWQTEPDGTRTLKVLGDADMASSGFRGERSGVRPEVRAAYEALLKTMFKKAETYVEDTVKADNFTARTREDLAGQLDSLRRELSAQKDPTYYKRNNKPASAEQLAEFDTIAKAMLEGDASAVATEWRSVKSSKAAIASRWTNDSLERLSEIYKAVRGRSGFDATNRNGLFDRLRGYMERYSQRLKMLAEAQSGAEKQRMVPTDFAMNARELDQGRGTDYWTTPHEMAARAFQGYVDDKVAERGGVSRFLNYGPENVGIPTPWGFKRPFPAGAERKAINAAFDNFVGLLQTREDDRGNVAVFSRAPNTAAFREWFGDSKVVDAQGGPLVVYHGTPEAGGITEFNMNQGAAYFTSSSQVAGGYTSRRGVWRSAPTGAVVPAYLALQNPLVVDALGKRNDNIPVPWQEWKPKVFGNLPPNAMNMGKLVEYAKAKGHDGAIVRNVVDTANPQETVKSDVFIAFRPEQIKSAIGNRGTFDVSDPDIAFSRAGSGAGIAKRDAQALVAAIREANPTAPPIHLVDAVSKAPEALLQDIRDAGAAQDVEAAYHDGEIYVFYKNIASIERALFVVGRHELRHHGLRSMLGPRLGPVLMRMGMDNAALNRAARAKMADGQAADYVTGVEEALADMPVEALAALKGWDRLVAAFRNWLRRLADNIRRVAPNLADLIEPSEWTDNDVAAMVQRAEAVSRGGEAKYRNSGTAFERAPAVTVDVDDDGLPSFVGNGITIAFPQETERFEVMPEDGERVVNYAIMPAEGFDVLGHVELLIRDGKPVSLLDIEVNPSGRRAGVGRRTVETLLAANPTEDLNISNIVHAARGFWERMGVPAQNLEDGAAYDGTLNWQTYAQAADAEAANGDARARRSSSSGGDAGRAGAGRRPSSEAQGQGQAVATRFSRDSGRQAILAAIQNAGGGPRIVGRTTRQYTDAQLDAFRAVGFETQAPTLEQRAKALWQDAGKKLAQGLVDQFAPVKEISSRAYGLLRLAKGASGAFETLLHGGRLKLTDGVYDFDEANRGGVIDRLLKPLGGEHHDFLRWVAANRAERLMSEGKENLFTPEAAAAIKTLTNGTTEFDYILQHGERAGQVTRDRTLIYPDALKTFNQFNKNVLDLAEQSGLIDGESRKLWEHEFYVPFYRVADEESGGIRGMNIKGSAVRQEAFKQLKGGKQALNADLLDNTLMNWAHLLDAAAKNRAAKATLDAAEKMGLAVTAPESTAREMANSMGKKGSVVWVMDDGVKHHYLVEDPYLLTALTSLEYAGMRNPVMNAMGAFKHALTVGVTASPFFKVRNLLRDSVQAIGAAPLGANPVKNVTEGWKLTDPKSDEWFRLLAGGGTIHFGTMLEGSEAKRVQALVESGVDQSTILNSDQKVKAFYRKFIEPAITAYNELGNRGEAVNRASLYAQLRKQGLDHAQASLQARDLMDFSMQGSFASIRFLTQVVPFFNARLQGLYKLGRAAKEDPRRLAAVIGASAALSVGLLVAFSGDEDWKKREDWDRNNFWWFKFGGMAFRIPKPFEIGAVATLAERGFELAFEREMTGKRFRQQVLTLLGDNLSMNPIPQLVKPMLDVYANRDSFSGRPIETMGMDRLRSDYRYTAGTSMVARATSTAANAVTGLVGAETLSPVQIDHLLRGYFGWLGSFVVGAGDVLARPASGQPTRPEADLWKAASGSMVSDLRDAPSRYVSQVYEQAKVIEQAYATWRELLKQGKVTEATAFFESNAKDIVRHKAVESVKRQEAAINQQVRQVERSDATPAEKRERIRLLLQRKDAVARQLAPAG